MGGAAEKNARELLFAPVVGEREVLSLSFTEKVDFQRRFRIGVIHRHRVHKSELALPECDAPIHLPRSPAIPIGFISAARLLGRGRRFELGVVLADRVGRKLHLND